MVYLIPFEDGTTHKAFLTYKYVDNGKIFKKKEVFWELEKRL